MQAAAPVEGWDVPKTLGILNIVFGVICGVCQGAGIAGVFTMIASFKSAGGNSEAGTILTVALGLMAVAMVLLLMQLISGVGLLMKKKWGRTLAIVFAVGFILVGIGDLVLEFVLIPDAMSGSSEEIARNIGHTIGKNRADELPRHPAGFNSQTGSETSAFVKGKLSSAEIPSVAGHR